LSAPPAQQSAASRLHAQHDVVSGTEGNGLAPVVQRSE
jgi:hypothetical protein